MNLGIPSPEDSGELTAEFTTQLDALCREFSRERGLSNRNIVMSLASILAADVFDFVHSKRPDIGEVELKRQADFLARQIVAVCEHKIEQFAGPGNCFMDN